MTSLKDSLLWALKVCPGCGSFQPQQSLLCFPCEKRVLLRAGCFSEKISGFPVRFLFRWNPGESDLLSRLFISLKGPHQERAWQWWSQVFLDFHSREISREPRRIVGAPVRRKNSPADHSTFFSKALAEGMGVQSEGPLFCKGKEESSRRLDLYERQMRRKLVKITDTIGDPNGFWVMADDILTTGSTARAIYEGLASPLKFEVWCLAYRTRSSCDA